MKKILTGLLFVFFVSGCSSHTVNKPKPSVQIQKQNAVKAWNELDNNN